MLIYGEETWTCITREKSSIRATEMKFLGPVTGKTKREKIRNAYFREEFRMDDIQNQIKGNRLR
jgi:hypothetical protein